ncbi:MAG TPA: hypothetical protein VM557_09950, partial [Thermoanaerobaculia bacterium]|nr:hypothetical protein [Thermoanaerobaculia bacterium]
MKTRPSLATVATVASLLLTSSLPAAAAPNQEKIYADFAKRTGLERTEVPGTSGEYLGKTHRGYPVLYTAKAGNV